MKITVGNLKRRTLTLPKKEGKKEAKKDGVRPTKSRIRQALINILKHALLLDRTSFSVLEPFGGTGIFSFEMISLGAKTVVCIEKSRDVFEMLKTNAQKLKINQALQLFHCDFFDWEPDPAFQGFFDIVFLDPPYFQNFIPQAAQFLVQHNLLAPYACLIAECSVQEKTEIQSALIEKGFLLKKERKYGRIVLGIYAFPPSPYFL
jgi:16S rRNA (guanine966-N2)-methyltransferase